MNYRLVRVSLIYILKLSVVSYVRVYYHVLQLVEIVGRLRYDFRPEGITGRCVQHGQGHVTICGHLGQPFWIKGHIFP